MKPWISGLTSALHVSCYAVRCTARFQPTERASDCCRVRLTSWRPGAAGSTSWARRCSTPATRMRGTPRAPSCCASVGRSRTACAAPTWRSGSSPACGACAGAQLRVCCAPSRVVHAQHRPGSARSALPCHDVRAQRGDGRPGCGAQGSACSACLGEDAWLCGPRCRLSSL